MTTSNPYDELSPGIQKWIWEKGWPGLRPIQNQAITQYNHSENHLIISAKTASGKTEAAFMPVLSHIELSPNAPRDGVEILYVAPLKALINDQYARLQDMTQYMDIPLYQWHGDANAGEKRRALAQRNGIILITPESLEGIITSKRAAGSLFSNTKAIIIDEMHAFLEDSRGRQLQSLMHRIELQRENPTPIRRIGLSATIADMKDAAEWIIAGDGHGVDVITEHARQPTTITNQAIIIPLRHRDRTESTSEENPFDININETDNDIDDPNQDEENRSDDPTKDTLAMALWHQFSGHKGLIFANSRAKVEVLTARLESLQELNHRPSGFIAHHGSLSRVHRHHAEQAMKDDSIPHTLLCTSTMEMGVDIGGVEEVGQIGPAPSVSSLRQRAGRSGRQSGRSHINQYIELYAHEVRDKMGPADALCLRFIRMLATSSLLNKGWNEPVNHRRHDLSTLMHQILATIKQREGANAKTLWRTLSPVWPQVDQQLFIRLLKNMAEEKIIESGGGTLILPGEVGERLVNKHDFPVTFSVAEEYTVRPVERPPIGSIPVDSPISIGNNIIFGGKYWKITHIDNQQKVISVTEARHGTPPTMLGEMGMIHDVILEEMRQIYLGKVMPEGMDKITSETLGQAQAAFYQYNLDKTNIINHNGSLLLFPWAHPSAVYALVALLTDLNYECIIMGEYIQIENNTLDALLYTLERHADTGLSDQDIQRITNNITIPNVGKYDEYIATELLQEVNARDYVDFNAIPAICSHILGKYNQHRQIQ